MRLREIINIKFRGFVMLKIKFQKSTSLRQGCIMLDGAQISPFMDEDTAISIFELFNKEHDKANRCQKALKACISEMESLPLDEGGQDVLMQAKAFVGIVNSVLLADREVIKK
jgi:hypothetical protein